MENVSNVIKKLSWGTPEDEKEEAMKKLQYIRDEDLHLLLQPISKEYWDGAAETVIRLGYPRVKSILPGLLEWIQDRNWPGAGEIADFLLEIGDPMIPYVKDVLNQHSEDQEWVYWIFEVLINHWNTVQILQIQAELIKISQEKANDLSALRILLTHGIYAKDVVCEIIQRKKAALVFELKELHDTHPEIDCEALHKEFFDQQPNVIKQFHEHNKDRFYICNAISNRQEVLSEIEIFTAEFLT
ncbi:hypothetical protein CA600_08640 [Paenibacillus sp. VTT E-133280]|uniref:DUF5071 domain-containing protein n=1 Tax=Paenibacillus sp. VTT E-133280 TaxID=1986222 RepID=UPI000BA0B7ED|nr:DUF5071 domain-containing protein [Paenibacillus sp. VTT E-133280]OZQ67434.1 hypothetical protein CA600_08640 [Paenibacillus sp. VTT E-133280]